MDGLDLENIAADLFVNLRRDFTRVAGMRKIGHKDFLPRSLGGESGAASRKRRENGRNRQHEQHQRMFRCERCERSECIEHSFIPPPSFLTNPFFRRSCFPPGVLVMRARHKGAPRFSSPAAKGSLKRSVSPGAYSRSNGIRSADLPIPPNGCVLRAGERGTRCSGMSRVPIPNEREAPRVSRGLSSLSVRRFVGVRNQS